MRRVLFGLLATLAIALAAAVYFRAGLLDLALRQGLVYAGIREPELRVAAVTLSHIEIVGIELGPDLQLATLRLEYQPAGLVSGRLEGITLEGLRLDLTAPRGGAIERLAALASGDEDAPSDYVPPPIALRDASVRWQSPLGPVQVGLDGRTEPDAAKALHGRFDIVAEARAGRLQGQVTVERQADGTLKARYSVPGGELTFDRARLAGVSLQGNVHIDDAGGVKLAGEARLAALYLDRRAVGSAHASIELVDRKLALSLAGTALGAPFDLALQGALDLPENRLRLERAVLTAEPSHEAPLLSALGLPAFRGGTARLYLAAGGATFPIGPPPASSAGLLALIEESGLQGTATVSAEAWSLEGWFDDLALVCGLDFDTDGEGLAVRLAAPALIEAARLSGAAMAKLGLPEALHPLLEERLALELEPGPAPGPALMLTGGAAVQATLGGALRAELAAADRLVLDAAGKLTAGLWPEWRLTTLNVERLRGQASDFSLGGQRIRQLDIDGTLFHGEDAWSGTGTVAAAVEAPRLGTFTARQLALDLPLSYSVAEQRATLRLTAPGSLYLQQANHQDTLELPPELRLHLSEGSGPLLVVSLSAQPRYRASLSARPAKPVDLRLTGGTEPVPVRLGDTRLNVTATGSGTQPPALAAQLSAGSLELPKQRVRAEAVTIDLKLDDPSPSGAANYRIERLVYLDPELPLPPFSLAGSATLQDDTATFDATIGESEGPLRLIAAGRYDLEAARLDGKVALTPTELPALLPTLHRLYPAADSVTALHGRIAGRADFNWAEGDVDGTGEIILDDVGIDTDMGKVAGIAGTLTLAGLWPPATDGPQRITIRAVEGPVQVRDIDIALRLAAVDGQTIGRIHIDEASGASDLARLALEQGELDLSAGEYTARLRVSELDLTELFQVADVEGLSGTGTLSGSIPLSYGRGGLAIEPGSLDAAGPGVIRFASEAAKQALAGGGEQVQLLLRALENFQYQALSIRLEKTAGGAASAKLAIRGHNPDVLDGHPFALNIDLSGNFDSLLATVLEAYDLSGQALRATVK